MRYIVVLSGLVALSWAQCPTALNAPDFYVSTPPNAPGNAYLWGTDIELEMAPGQNPQGDLYLIYSLDGGNTWISGPQITGFPFTYSLPSLTPPIYTATLTLAIEAQEPSGCSNGLTPVTSTSVNVPLTERPGNRPANAIPLTLTDNGDGTWSVVIQDSTNGPGISNEYGSGSWGPRGTGALELFFELILPACFDSLEVHTCNYASFDTHVSLLHANDNDTIVNDNGCSSFFFFSKIIAIGRPNSQKTYTGPLSGLSRDTMLLQAGDKLYIVVEGFSSQRGKFELSVTGYKQRPQPVISGAPTPSVCVSQGTVTLQATGATGASAYQWEVNGNVDLTNTTDSYTLNLTPGNHNVVVRAVYPNPNGPACDDIVASDPVTIMVDPLPDASIQVGSTTYANGATLTLSGTSNVTFNASSTVSGNSYSWALYSGSLIASGTGGSFTHTFNTTRRDTLVLTSTNGACTEEDTLYVDVTTGLLSGAGSFSVMPNPSQGAFMVVAPAAGVYELRVLDVAGREVYRDRMEGMRKELRLSLPAGTYQLVIQGEGRSGVVRLLITE